MNSTIGQITIAYGLGCEGNIMTTAQLILQQIVDDFGNAIPVHTLPYDVYMVRHGYFKDSWEG